MRIERVGTEQMRSDKDGDGKVRQRHHYVRGLPGVVEQDKNGQCDADYQRNECAYIMYKKVGMDIHEMMFYEFLNSST